MRSSMSLSSIMSSRVPASTTDSTRGRVTSAALVDGATSVLRAEACCQLVICDQDSLHALLTALAEAPASIAAITWPRSPRGNRRLGLPRREDGAVPGGPRGG